MNNFLAILDNFFNTCTGFLFGPIMLVVFFGTGILMTIVTKGVQFRKFGTALREVFGNLKKKDTGDGQLKPFEALATALSSCVGNGNVVGVAAALVSGGPVCYKKKYGQREFVLLMMVWPVALRFTRIPIEIDPAVTPWRFFLPY